MSPSTVGLVVVIIPRGCTAPRQTRLVEGVDDETHYGHSDEVANSGRRLHGGSVVVAVTSSVAIVIMTVTSFALMALLCQIKCILQPTRAAVDVWVFRVVIAFTGHLHRAKSVCIVHVCLAFPLDIEAVRAAVVTLDHLRSELATVSRATNTLELWNR